MNCTHSLPDADEISVEVSSVNEYGKYMDSLGSPQVTFEFNCPDCGQRVSAKDYADIQEGDVQRVTTPTS